MVWRAKGKARCENGSSVAVEGMAKTRDEAVAGARMAANCQCYLLGAGFYEWEEVPATWEEAGEPPPSLPAPPALLFDHEMAGRPGEVCSDDVIPYVGWDGSPWKAQLRKDGVFVHRRKSMPREAFPCDIIKYVTWDGSCWNARMAGNHAFVCECPDRPGKTFTDYVLEYVRWDGSHWRARVR